MTRRQGDFPNLGARGCAWIALVALGCNTGTPPEHTPRRTEKRPLNRQADSTSTMPSSGIASRSFSAETQRELSQLRNRAQRFTPREDDACKLEFFGNHLARLTGNNLHLISIADTLESSRPKTKTTAITEGRELARLADNSLLVVTKTATLLFDSQARAKGNLGKIAYFPGARLWPEMRFPYAFATFDPKGASYSLYRYDPNKSTANNTQGGSLYLPEAEAEFPQLANSRCTLLRDGTYACTDGTSLWSGFPGRPPQTLGSIEPGATVVRLLQGPRADRVLVLRSDARLEQYWAIAPPKRLSSIDLPWVPFDVMALKDAYLILQLETPKDREIGPKLVVIESSGKTRWQVPLDTITTPRTAAEFDRDLYNCQSLAAHPQKPWVAVSNCRNVRVFDAQSGQPLANIDDAPF